MEQVYKQLEQQDARLIEIFRKRFIFDCKHHFQTLPSIRCFHCREHVPGYVFELHRHVNNHIQKGHFSASNTFFDCTFWKCSARYANFYSLKRHILDKHSAAQCQPTKSIQHSPPTNTQSDSVSEHGFEEEFEEKGSLDEIKHIIKLSICRMTSDVGLPHSKISEFVKLCDTITRHVSGYLEQKTCDFLNSQKIDLNSEKAIELRNMFRLDDLLCDINTFPKQSKFINTLAGSAPIPREILLSRREDVRHVNSISKKVMVNETA